MLVLIVGRDVAEDQPLGRNDFEKLTFHRAVVAVGPAHHDSQTTACSYIKLSDRNGESTRSEPLRHHFRIGPGFPDEYPRRIKDASKGDAPLSIGRSSFCCGHRYRPA